jgi:hypothetical protein
MEEGLTGSWDEARRSSGGSHGVVVKIEPVRLVRRAAASLNQPHATGRRGGGGSPRIYKNQSMTREDRETRNPSGIG